MRPLFLFSPAMQDFMQLASDSVNRLRSVFIWIVLPLGFAVLGCGYVSTSDYLSHIKSVSILPLEIQDPDFTFDVASGRPYDEVIREQLIDRFKQKWPDGNDAQLDMRILDYRLEPIAYNVSNQPEQFRMSLLIEYEFRDRVRNRVIDRKDNYVQIHEYYFGTDRGGEPPETHQQARAKLIQELVDDFYSALAEQW